jgi:hypothetical protein
MAVTKSQPPSTNRDTGNPQLAVDVQHGRRGRQRLRNFNHSTYIFVCRSRCLWVPIWRFARGSHLERADHAEQPRTPDIGTGIAASSCESRNHQREHWVMHPIEIRCVRLAAAITALLCLLAAPALGDDRPWEQARWHALDAHFFSSQEGFLSGQHPLESQLHTTERHGFEYSRSLSLNLERRFVFNIRGPLVWESAPVLAFEVRF